MVSAPDESTNSLQSTQPCGKDIARTRHLWRTATAVCFDVDSTVTRDECIDELANFVGKGEEVALLTRRAMGGQQSFREALSARLNIIRPSREVVSRYIAEHKVQLTPGVAELIKVLQDRGVHVYLVSGGFTITIAPVAKMLNIPLSKIFANVLQFDGESGAYSGFDAEQPTSATGGKAAVCAKLLAEHAYSTLLMVGDGATDMEASPPAHGCIGFGGNVRRKVVMEKCGWFVDSFQELIDELRQ